MTASPWSRDTIAWRFGTTIVASMTVACTLIALFFAFGGIWAQPPMDAAARLDGAMAIIHILEATPPQMRQAATKAAVTKTYRLDWYAETSSISTWLDNIDVGQNEAMRSPDLKNFGLDLMRRVVTFSPSSTISVPADFPLRSNQYPDASFFAVRLQDSSWAVFTGFKRDWGLSQSWRLAISILFIFISFVIVSAIATRQLSRPIRQFAKAVRHAGANSTAPSIAEEGPRELREVIGAFNEMRVQIHEFVAYRTSMLAAISHDLRTPLTRMRLRGEYIDNKTQQSRLFRDVDEMQAMIDGALAFFRGDADEEASRAFNLTGILQSIQDDYADQDIEIRYSGPNNFVYVGRPIALKRAFTNLIENAVKYGSSPQIELICQAWIITVTIRDYGPGIPAEALEIVFKPFFRLDKSRNRATGGVGLGLTAAQAIIRGHGGQIVLRNHPDGGLEATISLPHIS